MFELATPFEMADVSLIIMAYKAFRERRPD
jgi:hypothetical protein